MNFNQFLKSTSDWLLPPVIFNQLLKMFFLMKNARSLSLTKSNIGYKNIHQGERCFILCNGPSVNKQDLRPLKEEIVFSVSSGYHHKDYAVFKPRYHCVPYITYTDKWTKDVTVSWFKEMHEQLGEAELFLSNNEEPLVREYNLFEGRKVSYLCMFGDFIKSSDKLADITGLVPGICSVPVMCLIIAMYMGFRDIYLLGVDHDSFMTREYKYFFKQTVLDGKTGGVTSEEKISDPLCDELYGYYRLFSQYRELKRIADANGVKIYNATAGGALDEFPRVELEKVFHESEN